MRKTSLLLASVCLFATMPLAFAQDIPVATTTTAPQIDTSSPEFSRALASVMMGAAQDNAVNSMTQNMGSEEDEVETVYQYDAESDVFYGVPYPERTFNNINYPY